MKLCLSQVGEFITLDPPARSIPLGTPPCANKPDTLRSLPSHYRLGMEAQATEVCIRGMVGEFERPMQC